MSDYESRKQMRAVTSHGKKHSSTITALFPAPPELPEKKPKRVHSKKRIPKGDTILDHMSISIDLNVEEHIPDETLIDKLRDFLGVERVEKEYEVLETTMKIIRAFHKAKFKNVNLIRLDGEEIYNNPRDYFDSDEAIDTIIRHIKENGKSGNFIHMYLSSEEHPCKAEVEVSRVHLPFTHDILITFDGELENEYFRRVINYLEDHLAIEDMDNEWSKA